MIRVENLSKAFVNGKKVKKVVDYVSLEVNYGELVGFVGKSGEGKSTLARAMVGEFKVDCGNVFIDEKPLFVDGKYDRKLGKNIQIIPQQPYSALDPTMTVGSSIIEAIMISQKISKQQAKQQAIELFKIVNLDESLFNRLPDYLSGGQAQRVVIARSIAVKPKMIISDEATSMLDVISQMQILEIFSKLAKQGMAILLISHDISLVKHFCDRAYKIEQGKVKKIELRELN